MFTLTDGAISKLAFGLKVGIEAEETQIELFHNWNSFLNCQLAKPFAFEQFVGTIAMLALKWSS